MSNAPRPAEFRPEVAEIRETGQVVDKYSPRAKNQKWGTFVRNSSRRKKLEQGGEEHGN